MAHYTVLTAGRALATYYPLSGEVTFDWPAILEASRDESCGYRGMALMLLAARRVGSEQAK